MLNPCSPCVWPSPGMCDQCDFIYKTNEELHHRLLDMFENEVDALTSYIVDKYKELHPNWKKELEAAGVQFEENKKPEPDQAPRKEKNMLNLYTQTHILLRRAAHDIVDLFEELMDNYDLHIPLPNEDLYYNDQSLHDKEILALENSIVAILQNVSKEVQKDPKAVLNLTDYA